MFTKRKNSDNITGYDRTGYHVIYGGFHDLDIYPENKEARDKVVEIIRTVKPDLILTHYPQDYMPDHTATSKLVFDASFAATVPHYQCKVEGATKVVPLYYFSSLSIVAKFWGKQSGCKYAEVFCKCYADMKITTKTLLP